MTTELRKLINKNQQLAATLKKLPNLESLIEEQESVLDKIDELSKIVDHNDLAYKHVLATVAEKKFTKELGNSRNSSLANCEYEKLPPQFIQATIKDIVSNISRLQSHLNKNSKFFTPPESRPDLFSKSFGKYEPRNNSTEYPDGYVELYTDMLNSLNFWYDAARNLYENYKTEAGRESKKSIDALCGNLAELNLSWVISLKQVKGGAQRVFLDQYISYQESLGREDKVNLGKLYKLLYHGVQLAFANEMGLEENAQYEYNLIIESLGILSSNEKASLSGDLANFANSSECINYTKAEKAFSNAIEQSKTPSEIKPLHEAKDAAKIAALEKLKAYKGNQAKNRRKYINDLAVLMLESALNKEYDIAKAVEKVSSKFIDKVFPSSTDAYQGILITRTEASTSKGNKAILDARAKVLVYDKLLGSYQKGGQIDKQKESIQALLQIAEKAESYELFHDATKYLLKRANFYKEKIGRGELSIKHIVYPDFISREVRKIAENRAIKSRKEQSHKMANMMTAAATLSEESVHFVKFFKSYNDTGSSNDEDFRELQKSRFMTMTNLFAQSFYKFKSVQYDKDSLGDKRLHLYSEDIILLLNEALTFANQIINHFQKGLDLWGNKKSSDITELKKYQIRRHLAFYLEQALGLQKIWDEVNKSFPEEVSRFISEELRISKSTLELTRLSAREIKDKIEPILKVISTHEDAQRRKHEEVNKAKDEAAKASIKAAGLEGDPTQKFLEKLDREHSSSIRNNKGQRPKKPRKKPHKDIVNTTNSNHAVDEKSILEEKIEDAEIQLERANTSNSSKERYFAFGYAFMFFEEAFEAAKDDGNKDIEYKALLGMGVTLLDQNIQDRKALGYFNKIQTPKKTSTVSHKITYGSAHLAIARHFSSFVLDSLAQHSMASALGNISRLKQELDEVDKVNNELKSEEKYKKRATPLEAELSDLVKTLSLAIKRTERYYESKQNAIENDKQIDKEFYTKDRNSAQEKKQILGKKMWSTIKMSAQYPLLVKNKESDPNKAKRNEYEKQSITDGGSRYNFLYEEKKFFIETIFGWAGYDESQCKKIFDRKCGARIPLLKMPIDTTQQKENFCIELCGEFKWMKLEEREAQEKESPSEKRKKTSEIREASIKDSSESLIAISKLKKEIGAFYQEPKPDELGNVMLSSPLGRKPNVRS